MRTQADKVAKETKDLEMVIDKKVAERMKSGTSKWSNMSFKTKLEVVFLGMGIIAFTTVAFKNLKGFRLSSPSMSSGGAIGGEE